ncbi:HIPL1 protein-like [Papaver somniferum]|uniref:HIPL1 protein-like n=1 Tax=Papaver somniferum TaxID=3469 RepID=UPI000E7045B5|nr:HIPL1 protein-like [Papaver somniferum]
MVIDESNLFLDLTDIMHVDTEFGLLSVAFHPIFVHNGRFFASYICDGDQWFHVTLSEFTVNNSAINPALATRGNPSEVRRIFMTGIAYKNAIASQLLFGPDRYLYNLTRVGKTELDPYNHAQNKKSMLWKLLKFDVDNFPSEHYN